MSGEELIHAIEAAKNKMSPQLPVRVLPAVDSGLP